MKSVGTRGWRWSDEGKPPPAAAYNYPALAAPTQHGWTLGFHHPVAPGGWRESCVCVNQRWLAGTPNNNFLFVFQLQQHLVAMWGTSTLSCSATFRYCRNIVNSITTCYPESKEQTTGWFPTSEFILVQLQHIINWFHWFHAVRTIYSKIRPVPSGTRRLPQ